MQVPGTGRLPVLLAFVLLTAGCLSGASGTPPSTGAPTATGTPTEVSTDTPTTTPVEYRVRAGTVPEEFESVEVTFRVVFPDRETDLGPCYPGVFRGPYKPTLTPIGTPTGDCHRSETVTVDLAELESGRSLGPFDVPGSASGHALLVTGVTATDRNGTTVTDVKNVGGAELLEERASPRGTYGVRVSVESVEDDRDYGYWLVWERFDPAG
jgi:hypothetical protein